MFPTCGEASHSVTSCCPKVCFQDCKCNLCRCYTVEPMSAWVFVLAPRASSFICPCLDADTKFQGRGGEISVLHLTLRWEASLNHQTTCYSQACLKHDSTSFQFALHGQEFPQLGPQPWRQDVSKVPDDTMAILKSTQAEAQSGESRSRLRFALHRV